MTTRRPADASENPTARWQRWIRDRASEHGSIFPPPGVDIPDRSGTLKNWVAVLNRNLGPGEKDVSTSTVRGWLVKPSPAACLRVAHALGLPEEDVFAVAYGTTDRATELADRPAIDPDAQLLNEMLNNPGIEEPFRQSLRDMVRAMERVRPDRGSNGGKSANAS